MEYNIPNLIDNTTGYYLLSRLRQCHENRVTTYSFIFNFLVFFTFTGVTCFILYLCVRQKRTPEEEKHRFQQDQKFILEKIRALKEQKQNYYMEGSMTHLPFTTTNAYTEEMDSV